MSLLNSSTIQNNPQIANQNQFQGHPSCSNLNINSAFLSNNQPNSDNNIFQQKISNAEIISKSIVYGSIAFWLGKKSEQNLTHKWCVYVRGINNEDISYFVKEVVFTLHATFDNNVRTITKWPFELYASGWGEFDIKITIHLIDESFKPIEFIHFLKLYPPANQTPSTKKPIVSEFFDEIVFVNPKKHLRECLLTGSSNPGNLKRDTSIQIPLNFNKNDEDKKSESSHQEDSRYNLVNNPNAIENKLENLKIGNAFNYNSNSNDSQTHEMNFNTNYQKEQYDMEMEHFENNQYLDQQIGNDNINNDSMSVFSNNFLYIYFLFKFLLYRKILRRKMKIPLKTIQITFLTFINFLQLLMTLHI